MGDENNKKSKKNLAFKIIIPALIVCVIAGIWIVKNVFCKYFFNKVASCFSPLLQWGNSTLLQG